MTEIAVIEAQALTAEEAAQLNTDCPEFLSVYDFMAGLHEERGDLAAANFLVAEKYVEAIRALAKHPRHIAIVDRTADRRGLRDDDRRRRDPDRGDRRLRGHPDLAVRRPRLRGPDGGGPGGY